MKLRFFLTAFALVVTCFTTSAFAQGKGTTVVKSSFENPSYYNPCCDEYVTFSGTIHNGFKLVTNADGSVTFTMQQNLSNTKGVGQTSGITYTARQNDQQTQTYMPDPPNYPYTIKASTMYNVTGTGKDGHACSARVRITTNIVVDADGNVTVNDSNVEFICANGTEISQAVQR